MRAHAMGWWSSKSASTVFHVVLHVCIVSMAVVVRFPVAWGVRRTHFKQGLERAKIEFATAVALPKH